MAIITYGTDVAPHLQRALMYRRRRIRRWEVLHPRYDRDDYDPYAWAKRSRMIDVLAGLVALICFALIDGFGWGRTAHGSA